MKGKARLYLLVLLMLTTLAFTVRAVSGKSDPPVAPSATIPSASTSCPCRLVDSAPVGNRFGEDWWWWEKILFGAVGASVAWTLAIVGVIATKGRRGGYHSSTATTTAPTTDQAGTGKAKGVDDVAMVSLRGRKDQNEDSARHFRSDDGAVTVLAVGDGVSASARARVASRVATREAVCYLRSAEVALREGPLEERLAALEAAGFRAQQALAGYAARYDLNPHTDLCTTLTIVADTPSWLCYWQIGDCAAYWIRDIRLDNTYAKQLLATPQQAGNATAAISPAGASCPALVGALSKVGSGGNDYVILATDGLLGGRFRAAYKTATGWLPESKLYQMLVRRPVDSSVEDVLSAFMRDISADPVLAQELASDNCTVVVANCAPYVRAGGAAESPAGAHHGLGKAYATGGNSDDGAGNRLHVPGQAAPGRRDDHGRQPGCVA